MKILIHITKDVLRRSMMCGMVRGLDPAENCAITIALREFFPKAITRTTLLCVENHKITLPKKAQEFITKFDLLVLTPEERLNLPEVSFEVDLPNTLIQSIGIPEVYRILSESKTLELAENFESV